ncbi:YdeI/OmpD-associated family protein [Agriterribacter sp.]|uniref:YdeI/OmpD-associated family protein n=1 Tax=Agriterribacter sp. TaxID=2821509 RepID=UPI002C4FFD20|nr:YdeI/OmpD-associated family protein [Agriterribacter sp.]HRO46425.1 YdeI/OmpD-associated family protein [Agriterribacter sp.]HRQ17613.1 YdeI/OmpD-associated family protein [Agriterribacter sp.]
MVTFTATILKFGKKGEKTGWNYIEIPRDIAEQLKPATKTSFRVKGRLDDFAIKGVSLVPMGGGNFIMALNAAMRKGIRKNKGAMVKVQLTVDTPYEILPELLECLSDEPSAMHFFKQLPRSHQNYFSKWIEAAKTDATKAKRITQTINAMIKQQGYGEMIRSLKKDKDDLMENL